MLFPGSAKMTGRGSSPLKANGLVSCDGTRGRRPFTRSGLSSARPPVKPFNPRKSKKNEKSLWNGGFALELPKRFVNTRSENSPKPPRIDILVGPPVSLEIQPLFHAGL